MTAELVLILALVLANGVFSGAEIAVLSIRKSRLRQLVEEGSVRAKNVARLLDRPESFLATVQVGITVVGATAAAFGGASIASRLSPHLARIPWIESRAEPVSLGIVVVAVSFLSLVLGELVPKSLALKFGERYALLLAGPLLFLSSVARPLVFILTASSNLLLRPFGDRTTFTESRLSAEELRQLVREAGKLGTLDSRAGEIAARAIEFDELEARDVMVPRDRIIAVSKTATREQLTSVLLEGRHSRMPVFENDLDHVVGYVAADDLLTDVLSGAELDLEKRVRPVPFLAESKSASAVLHVLQQEKTRIAIVVDEFGGVSGLITFDDLVNEVLGELGDGTRTPSAFLKDPDGSFLVKGSARLHTLERSLDLSFPDGDYSTIAGLCIAEAGRIPARGEVVTLADGMRLEVVDASPRVVRSIRIHPAKAA